MRDTQNHIPYTDSDAKDDPDTNDVWTALRLLDKDPNNSSNVLDIYNYNNSMPYDPHGTSSSWNREHLLCQSYGIQSPGDDHDDLHNLRAIDWGSNSARNNLYYDDCYEGDGCISPAYQGNYYSSANDTSKNSLKFTPPAVVRGDIARDAMYMALRYNGTKGPNGNTGGDKDSTQITLSPCPCVLAHKFGNLTTLLRWAEDDPVSDAEMNRSQNVCIFFQNNLNPFIDYPWLSQAFSLDPPISMIVSPCTDDYVDPDNCPYDPSEYDHPTTHPSPAPTEANTEPTLLSSGSIVIIGYDSTDPDALEIVNLQELKGHEIFYITGDA